jgi:hypothetical protein
VALGPKWKKGMRECEWFLQWWVWMKCSNMWYQKLRICSLKWWMYCMSCWWHACYGEGSCRDDTYEGGNCWLLQDQGSGQSLSHLQIWNHLGQIGLYPSQWHRVAILGLFSNNSDSKMLIPPLHRWLWMCNWRNSRLSTFTNINQCWDCLCMPQLAPVPISFAVNTLAQHALAPGEPHLQALKCENIALSSMAE